jgi:hypothetical protein
METCVFYDHILLSSCWNKKRFGKNSSENQNTPFIILSWGIPVVRHIKVKCGGGQNTTGLLVVIKQLVSAYSEAIFKFTKC